MATTTSITSTYAGEFAGKYISAALLSGSTIENGLITVKPNVKFKEVLKKVATDANVIKDATCDFTPTGTLTLTERILQPEEFQINLNLCKKDFRSDWEAVQMGYSAYDNLPPAFSDFILAHVAGLVAEKTEQNIWSGQNSNAGEFDGFYYLATAGGAGTVAVSGSPLNASNIIDEMGKVVTAIPSGVYGKEDLYIYVSRKAAKLYVRALGGFGANGLGAAGVNAQGTQWWNNGALSYDGVKVVIASGLPDDSMMAAQKSNLYFGTGLLSDHNEVKLLDMSDLDGSQNCRVVMRFTAGVQIGIAEDVVIYA
jgi:hypothetical protein